MDGQGAAYTCRAVMADWMKLPGVNGVGVGPCQLAYGISDGKRLLGTLSYNKQARLMVVPQKYESNRKQSETGTE